MHNSIALSFFIFLLYLCGRAHSKMPSKYSAVFYYFIRYKSRWGNYLKNKIIQLNS